MSFSKAGQKVTSDGRKGSKRPNFKHATSMQNRIIRLTPSIGAHSNILIDVTPIKHTKPKPALKWRKESGMSVVWRNSAICELYSLGVWFSTLKDLFHLNIGDVRKITHGIEPPEGLKRCKVKYSTPDNQTGYCLHIEHLHDCDSSQLTLVKAACAGRFEG